MEINKLKSRFAALLLVIVSAVAMTSCEGDPDYYYSDLVGSWQLVESGGQPIYDYQTDYYTFYSDGTGYYSYYDQYGNMWDEPFYWSERAGGRLLLSYDNPALGNETCYYRYDGRYMYFSTSPSFYTYTVYAVAR